MNDFLSQLVQLPMSSSYFNFIKDIAVILTLMDSAKVVYLKL